MKYEVEAPFSFVVLGIRFVGRVRIQYIVEVEGQPAMLNGPPERCSEGVPPILHITAVLFSPRGKNEWYRVADTSHRVSVDDYTRLYEIAEDHYWASKELAS